MMLQCHVSKQSKTRLRSQVDIRCDWLAVSKKLGAWLIFRAEQDKFKEEQKSAGPETPGR